MNKREITLTAAAREASSRKAFVMTEHYMRSWDKAALYYRVWHPGSPGRKALLVFHGSQEHSGDYRELAERLKLEDVSMFAWDMRGHGRSFGEPGYARHFANLVKDADAFVRVVSVTHGISPEDMVILGQGLGGVIVSTWLHDYAPPVRAAILASPAFSPRLGLPLPRATLHLLKRTDPEGYIRVRPGQRSLAEDRPRAEREDEGPLIPEKLGVRMLAGLFDAAERVSDGAGSIRTPVLVLSADTDAFARLSPQKRFFERLGSAEKRMEVFPASSHRVLQDQNRHIPLLRARLFIQDMFSQPACAPANQPQALPPRGRVSLGESRAPWPPQATALWRRRSTATHGRGPERRHPSGLASRIRYRAGSELRAPEQA